MLTEKNINYKQKNNILVIVNENKPRPLYHCLINVKISSRQGYTITYKNTLCKITLDQVSNLKQCLRGIVTNNLGLKWWCLIGLTEETGLNEIIKQLGQSVLLDRASKEQLQSDTVMTIFNIVLCISFLIVVVASDGKVNRVASRPCLPHNYNQTIYDFTVPDIYEKENVSLSKYRGKVVLIVNVATYCSFTDHYLGLNELQTKYKDDLVVLGFPCNQFLLQEPGTGAEEILNGVKYIRPGKGFEPNFPLFTKIDVNGENELPLYTFLKQHCPATRDGYVKKANLFYEPIRNWDLRWNWEKILVDKSGKPVLRYDASTEPNAIVADIEKFAKA